MQVTSFILTLDFSSSLTGCADFQSESTAGVYYMAIYTLKYIFLLQYNIISCIKTENNVVFTSSCMSRPCLVRHSHRCVNYSILICLENFIVFQLLFNLTGFYNTT